MNLILNETSKVEFHLAIAGTQMRPSEVRVVLGDGARLVFNAESTDNSNYFALVTPLQEVVGSTCLITIEVLFGDKIYVPIRRQITIGATEVVSPVVADTIPTTPPNFEPVQVVEPTPEIEPVQIAEPETAEEENKPLEVITVEAIKPVKIDNELLKVFESVKKASKKATAPSSYFIPPAQAGKKMQKIAEGAKKIAPLTPFNEVKPMGIEVDAVKVSRSIFAEANDKIEPTAKKKKQLVISEHVNPFPVSIKREEIVYI